MTKIVLNHVNNLNNPNSAVAIIDGNTDAITAAFENTLSRDGTSPNQMGAALDMNSNHIINLPAPIGSNDPVRLVDLENLVLHGTITTIPSGGTTGQVLTKTANTDYSVAWQAAPSAPVAGTNIVLTGTNPITISTSLTPTFTNVTIGATNVSTFTGSGAVVLANTPTLITPVLGVATATTINKVTLTAPATAATLTLTNNTTVTGPALTGTLATLANTETLSNKTLTAPTITGTTTMNDSRYTLPPFVNAEVPVLILSGAMDPATQGETVQIFDTFGANSNGTILFSKSGGGAEFTGSVTGSVLTVTAMGPGSLPLAVGQVVMAPPNPGSLPYGTLISSFGTGAGGTGTYNLSNSTTGGNIGSELILTNDLPTSPTATKNGQGVGFIVASGWYDNAGTPTRTNQSSVIQFNAEGDFTSTSWPSGINFVTTPTGSTAVSGAGNLLRVNIASSGALNQFQNGIGSTLTDGIALKNNTAAAVGAQQQSPSLHFAGQGWKTNATAASQPVDWWVTNAPIQGTANPTSSLVFSYAINNGAVTRSASFTAGGIDIVGGGGLTIGGAAPTAGHVLRGNGTAFVDGQLDVSELTGLPVTFAQGGTNDTGTAPTSFTPTVNFTGGTVTSSSGSTGVFKRLAAKVYYVQYSLSITYSTIPTSFNVTLPNGFTTAATGGLFGQNTTTGAIVQARSTATSTTAGNIIDYAGNLAITGSGQTIILSGVLTNT